MSAHKRPPLLSDDVLVELTYVKEDGRRPSEQVRDIYEAARAKDAELIDELTQKLDEANRLAQNWGLQVAKDAELIQMAVDLASNTKKWQDGYGCDAEDQFLSAAAAVGFKPSEP